MFLLWEEKKVPSLMESMENMQFKITVWLGIVIEIHACNLSRACIPEVSLGCTVRSHLKKQGSGQTTVERSPSYI